MKAVLVRNIKSCKTPISSWAPSSSDVKALIHFAKARAAAKAAGVEPANIGHGVGMVFGLLIVVLASICQHQFSFRSIIAGVLARTAFAGALYRRAVHLTPAARLRFPNSAVLNHVSKDLGPSALAGFALFLLIIPLQERIMAHQFSLWRGSMKWTDERAGRVLEVGSFLARLFRIRTQELRGIRKIQQLQSANPVIYRSEPIQCLTMAWVSFGF
ncbi:hypothetical protein B0H13DRAFT_1914418 [Mycena leptocephala]|nr:hypothetical protein B0H13DRAFT_1914418 [Mycena leptocephala]